MLFGSSWSDLSRAAGQIEVEESYFFTPSDPKPELIYRSDAIKFAGGLKMNVSASNLSQRHPMRETPPLGRTTIF